MRAHPSDIIQSTPVYFKCIKSKIRPQTWKVQTVLTLRMPIYYIYYNIHQIRAYPWTSDAHGSKFGQPMLIKPLSNFSDTLPKSNGSRSRQYFYKNRHKDIFTPPPYPHIQYMHLRHFASLQCTLVMKIISWFVHDPLIRDCFLETQCYIMIIITLVMDHPSYETTFCCILGDLLWGVSL